MARWASQLLTNAPSEWTQLFYANLDGFQWENPCMLHRHDYCLVDKILFNKLKGFGYNNYTKGLWLAWATLQNLLFSSLLGAWSPSSWTIQHFLSTLLSIRQLPPQSQRQTSAIFVRLNILTIADLWDSVRS